MHGRSLNLGILAHVDAGKTTLTERLLYLAGVVGEPGSVDAGTTQTDTLALERQRGITIRSAVASFVCDGVTVTIVDTPGHPDFIAEVERVLGVLDGAVLVISAVEGVQPQTRILMRALRRLNVPTLLFVNKVDRAGADVGRALAMISNRLTPDILPMGSVVRAGTRAAGFHLHAPAEPDFRDRWLVALAEHDERLLAAYVEGRQASAASLRAGFVAQTRDSVLFPVYAGSAATGAGVPELMQAIVDLLPVPPPQDIGEPSGRVFKVERGPAGDKVSYIRMFGGTLRLRQVLHLPDGRTGKVSGVQVLDTGGWTRADSIDAGQVGRVHGLTQVRVGDGFGSARAAERHHFAPPTLEAAVFAVHPEQGAALRAALVQLADQDPLIDVRTGHDGRPTVSLYGRVQQEVLGATLADEYGIEVDFAEASVLHVERPRSVGEAVLRLNTVANPYHATIGLRIAPGRPGSGVGFAVEAVAHDMPLYVFHSAENFVAAIDKHVRRALTHGRYGWQVTDCLVTLTECAYSVADGPPSRRGPTSTSYDYRQLTPIVLRQALARAETVVCEPVLRVLLDVPTITAAGVQRVVTRWGAEVVSLVAVGDLTQLEVRLVARRLHQLQRQLPDLTGGEGVLEPRFDGYRPVRGRPPSRAGWRSADYVATS